eukprot:TRINITY_DN116053_c0_g2_i9.p1 TRINITY_DN116053_c0_g2~~TRINITY_DN116053_c0_g2_i9.p1  ORF type:complete len:248 (-),score=5.87 TRINITY_DN116053_c0_g2_i9:169-810(-)
MSVFIIGLITINHTIILCCPNNSWVSNSISSSVACIVTWCVGILVSLIPFIPGLSHWGIQGQSGLCRLALFDHYKPKHTFRWFTVIVAINFVLCTLVLAAQIIIYKQTPNYLIVLEPEKRSFYSSVHLIRKVAVSSAVCWCSFGLVMLMASVGVTGLDNIYVTMVVFVLPLSSALYPFLYLWSLVTERGRQRQEKTALKVLKSRQPLSRKTHK